MIPVTAEISVVGLLEGRTISIPVLRYPQTGALVMRIAPAPLGPWDVLTVRLVGETDFAAGKSYVVAGYFGVAGEVDAHAVQAEWILEAPFATLPIDQGRTPALLVYGRLDAATVLRPRADGTIVEVPELVAFLLDLMAELHRRGTPKPVGDA